MTFTELQAFINEFVYTNHNNEITAATLNPVLQAIAEWANDSLGNLDDLNTTDKSNIVAAINELKSLIDGFDNFGIQLHSGTVNPNITPPASFSIADFYIMTDGVGNPITLFQWDGLVWSVSGSIPSENSPIEYLELRLKAKGVGNADLNIVEIGDIVEGFKDATTYWTSAMYNGGDPSVRSNYTPIEEVEDL